MIFFSLFLSVCKCLLWHAFYFLVLFVYLTLLELLFSHVSIEAVFQVFFPSLAFSLLYACLLLYVNFFVSLAFIIGLLFRPPSVDYWYLIDDFIYLLIFLSLAFIYSIFFCRFVVISFTFSFGSAMSSIVNFSYIINQWIIFFSQVACEMTERDVFFPVWTTVIFYCISWQ